MDLLIILIFAFIGLLALAKGELKITTLRVLSASRARVVGIGFLGLAVLYFLSNSQTDEYLDAAIKANALRIGGPGWSSHFFRTASDLRGIYMALSVGAGFVLTIFAFALSHKVAPSRKADVSSEPDRA